MTPLLTIDWLAVVLARSFRIVYVAKQNQQKIKHDLRKVGNFASLLPVMFSVICRNATNSNRDDQDTLICYHQ